MSGCVYVRTVGSFVLLVQAGSFKGGSTAEELVGPFGLVGAVLDGVVGLGLLGVV